MSRIDKLIADLCPDGVEFRTLGDILKIKNGKDHKMLGNGTIPAYGSGGILRNVDTAAAVGPSVLIPRKGSLGNIFYIEGPFWIVDTIFRTEIDTSKIYPKYLYHQLLTMRLGEMNQAGGVPSQTQKALSLLKVPVPPLEVQREIVRVLDKFTQLEAELEAELEARHRQYEHYRNHLLTFNKPKVPWVSIGSICGQVISGGTPLVTRREYYGGQIPWLRTQEVRYSDIHETETSITDAGLANSSARWIPKNSVIIAISGAGVTRGRAAVNKIPLTTNQHCCSLILDPTKAHYRFVYHYIRSQYEKLRSRGQGNRSDLTVGIIKDFLIPLPPLGEQEQIASVLDKFDSLVNDLSIGLPAELAARRKQYEYYRDRLLTFEEKR